VQAREGSAKPRDSIKGRGQGQAQNAARTWQRQAQAVQSSGTTVDIKAQVRHALGSIRRRLFQRLFVHHSGEKGTSAARTG